MKIFNKNYDQRRVYLLSVTESKKFLIDKMKYRDEQYQIVSESSIVALHEK